MPPSRKSKSPKRSASPRLKSNMLLSSSSPTKSTRSSAGMGSTSQSPTRKTVCGKRDGKLQCKTIETKDLPVPEALERFRDKERAVCAQAEALGVGVCDDQGNLFHYEDEIPTIHEEIDEYGNIIRQVMMEPKIVYVVDAEIESDTAKFLNASPYLERHLVNPDKLKQCYITTKDEIVHKNKLYRHLVCLATKTAITEYNGCSSMGSDITAMSKNILKYNVMTKVMSILNRFSSKTTNEKKEILKGVRQSLNTYNLGENISVYNSDQYYKKVRWNYGVDKSVTVKMPEALAVAISEKLVLDKLYDALNSYSIDSAEVPSSGQLIEWIRLILQSGTLTGNDLSRDIVAILLLNGITNVELNLEMDFCNAILEDQRSKALVIETSRDSEGKFVYSRDVKSARGLYGGRPRDGDAFLGVATRFASLASEFKSAVFKAYATALKNFSNNINNFTGRQRSYIEALYKSATNPSAPVPRVEVTNDNYDEVINLYQVAGRTALNMRIVEQLKGVAGVLDAATAAENAVRTHIAANAGADEVYGLDAAERRAIADAAGAVVAADGGDANRALLSEDGTDVENVRENKARGLTQEVVTDVVVAKARAVAAQRVGATAAAAPVASPMVRDAVRDAIATGGLVPALSTLPFRAI